MIYPNPQDELLGPPTKREKKPNKLRVCSEWGWDLGKVAFGKSDKAERREKIDKAVKELKK